MGTAPQELAHKSLVPTVGRLLAAYLVEPGADAEQAAAGIAAAGLAGIQTRSLAEVMALKACRLLVIDASSIGLEDLLNQLSAARGSSSVVALVDDPVQELAVLRSGAKAALRKPISASLLAWHLAQIRSRSAEAAAEQKSGELHTLQARAESLQRLATVITHEMSGPLGAVLVNAGTLRDRLARDRQSGQASWQALEELTAAIEDAGKRVRRSMDEMRSLARSGIRPPVRTNLAEAAKSAIAGVANPQQVAIGLKVEEDVHALALPDLLRHVLENLISNALHAVREVPSPQVTARVYAQAGEARISIRDNGAGVPPHLRARIFEPYFTTKGDEGMGVGLALCRELVARMGGALTLSSAGGGACFRVRLRPA